MRPQPGWLVAAWLAWATAASAAPASTAQPVTVYAAGSLRNTLTAMSEVLGAQYNLPVKLTFGPSGGLRERIEHGEHADLLLSADLGSPRQLASSGRTVLPVVAFARNAMCIISYRSAGLTADNLIQRMLQDKVRLKTSKPVADPSGDYAWAIFDRIDARRSGAGAVLKEKAQRSMSLATPAGAAQSPSASVPAQNPTAALFAGKQIDLAITYCSGAPEVLQALPDLVSLPIPTELDPHPVYGAALLSERPEAMRVLLVLLSEQGQELIAHAGLLPLLTSVAP
ncbi:MAG: substrate-binding domain-containing protein [Sinobacteraceae bacterium]|nr:substrate-binding domain-containing protein [Nevskiaceae bacterium]